MLAAFVPREDERPALAAVRARIGFDPCEQGERLTSGREIGLKDAKRVLREVCGDPARRRHLLAKADLDLLRARGVTIGLTAFLDELSTRVASAY